MINIEKSAISFAIEEIYTKMVESKNVLSKRSKDYRLGLSDAIIVLENIKLIETTQAQEYAEFCVRCDRENMPLLDFESYILTYGGNK
jgi:hypothetical protein